MAEHARTPSRPGLADVPSGLSTQRLTSGSDAPDPLPPMSEGLEGRMYPRSSVLARITRGTPGGVLGTARTAIVTPLGDRVDLLQVLRLYKPNYYYLELGSLLIQPPLSARASGELERVANGSSWSLDRIRVSLAHAEAPSDARSMPHDMVLAGLTR